MVKLDNIGTSMESMSFDNMVDLYNETRVFNRCCFSAALDFIVERFPPESFRHMLEPGIGTGRIAIDLIVWKEGRCEGGWH